MSPRRARPVRSNWLGRRSNSFSAGGAEIFNAVITAPQPFLEWIRFTTWANDDYKHLSFALGESNDKSPGSNCLRLRGSGSCQWGKAIGSSMLPHSISTGRSAAPRAFLATSERLSDGEYL